VASTRKTIQKEICIANSCPVRLRHKHRGKYDALGHYTMPLCRSEQTLPGILFLYEQPQHRPRRGHQYATPSLKNLRNQLVRRIETGKYKDIRG
jgi:hypothetical protein